MRYAIVLSILTVTVAVGLADESVRGRQIMRPLGAWTHTSEDGSKITLTIHEKSLTWAAELPDNGVTTMDCTAATISEDGVLYGYMKEIRWTNGRENRSIKQIFPFGFRFTIDDDKMELTELKLYGADQKAHEGYIGNYKKVSDPIRAEVQPVPTRR